LVTVGYKGASATLLAHDTSTLLATGDAAIGREERQAAAEMESLFDDANASLGISIATPECCRPSSA
jgi:hypothetical protein